MSGSHKCEEKKRQSEMMKIGRVHLLGAGPYFIHPDRSYPRARLEDNLAKDVQSFKLRCFCSPKMAAIAGQALCRKAEVWICGCSEGRHAPRTC